MQNELNELLTKAKELLKDEMTKISYETWIKNLEIQSFDNDIVVLVASSGFQKESIQSRYYDLLTNTFNFITNKENTALSVYVSLKVNEKNNNITKGKNNMKSEERKEKIIIDNDFLEENSKKEKKFKRTR